MIKSITKRLIPTHQFLKKSEWFVSLEKHYNNYLYKLLVITIVSAIIIPISFLISHFFESSTDSLTNILLAGIILFSTLIYLLISKNTTKTGTIALIICIIGFSLCTFLPNSKDAYLLTFFCFTTLAFQLKGKKKGLIWSIIFLISIAFLSIFKTQVGFTQWNIIATKTQIIMALIGFIFLIALNYFSEAQHEKYLTRIITGFVYDELSGCPNKNMLLHNIDESKKYLFIICRIENFSDLHTIFGFKASDLVFADFFNYMKHEEAKNYTLYRLKGDELGILIPLESNSNSDRFVKEDLKHTYQHASRFIGNLDNSEIRLNIRMGAIIIDNNNDNFIHEADIALKASIKNQRGYTLYENGEFIKEDARKNMTSFGVLVKNIEKETLTVYYQPIVNSVTGEIDWYESLLRVKNNEGMYESPFKYLRIAEKTGMDIDISNLVLKEAANALIKTDRNISINITMKDLSRPEFIELLKKTLDESKDSKGKLILEILEYYDLYEIEHVKQFIETVKEMGCLVAIDDFGAGYANFSNLLNLPIDIVKIDGSLVRQIEYNDRASDLLDTILLFGKKSGIHVAAEYVESMDLARILKKRGVRYLQGYFFGEPEELPTF
jgi:EAL domain-containing protein (putative c-di-GMP-specific phosphodiesterase class I)